MVLALAVASCSSSPVAIGAKSRPAPSLHMVAGGCNGTIVSDSVPPAWAQGGFTVAPGTPWVPWTQSPDGQVIAFLFATELVAGGVRPDGSANKVLWLVKGYGGQAAVKGHPVGHSQPTLEVPAGPSIVDAQVPGCWAFDVHWGTHDSSIYLEVLPAGSSPSTAGG